jgi:hypothetical protein
VIDATPLLRLYARHRLRQLARQRPAEDQARLLMALVGRANATRFGRDHGFGRINSVADFQAQVPVRAFDDFWADYWRDGFPRLRDVSWPGLISTFAVSSGTTTGETKYIPLTRPMLRANTRAAADILVHHIANRPASRVLAGRSFMLGGSSRLKTEAPGVFSGDISGIAMDRMPWWARARYFPPRGLARIDDWEEKMAALAGPALAADLRLIGGTPSWLLRFFDSVANAHPSGVNSAAALFPNLEVLVHGGVHFAPYRTRFAAWLEGSGAELREAYAASEGFIAIADAAPGEGMRLNLNGGLFYEFVPMAELANAEPTRHWAATIETGVDYAIVVTSAAGLWAYRLGDVVRFVDRDPPRLLVMGRTSYMMSATGEHLIDDELEEAIAAAATAIGETVTDFSVGARYPQGPGEVCTHVYVVEFASLPRGPAAETFARVVDEALCATNADYRAHRPGSLGGPSIEVAHPGTFAAWMKRRGKFGGQHKVPRVINDTDLFDDLLAFSIRRASNGGGGGA